MEQTAQLSTQWFCCGDKWNTDSRWATRSLGVNEYACVAQGSAAASAPSMDPSVLIDGPAAPEANTAPQDEPFQAIRSEGEVPRCLTEMETLRFVSIGDSLAETTVRMDSDQAGILAP